MFEVVQKRFRKAIDKINHDRYVKSLGRELHGYVERGRNQSFNRARLMLEGIKADPDLSDSERVRIASADPKGRSNLTPAIFQRQDLKSAPHAILFVCELYGMGVDPAKMIRVHHNRFGPVLEDTLLHKLCRESRPDLDGIAQPSLFGDTGIPSDMLSATVSAYISQHGERGFIDDYTNVRVIGASEFNNFFGVPNATAYGDATLEAREKIASMLTEEGCKYLYGKLSGAPKGRSSLALPAQTRQQFTP